MKEFLKNISIYGILPVIGKFAGFFLIPIYARVFSSYEFGIVELIISLMSFIMFACNLEFYTAIGRFFYERKTLLEKRKLISTGLFLTLLFTIIVIFLAGIFKDDVIRYYLDDGEYSKEYTASLVWLFFSAVYTYLGVIPRYDKKPKLYVLITVSSLLIRIGSTIYFVLISKTGIIGVIYGHILGSCVSTVLNSIVSWKYLGFFFNGNDAIKIFKFAVPIVPGLLLIGFWNPLSRDLVAKYFSVKTVGLLSFALRITSVLEIVNSAIRLAWNPLVFENYKNPNFNIQVQKISNITGIVALWATISLTLTSKEIATYIGTQEYSESSLLIGFLAFRGSLELLRRLRGFGPLLMNKTYILTMNEILGIFVGFILLVLFKDSIGIIGIGIAFVVPSIVKYFFLVSYTKKQCGVNFHGRMEFILWGVFLTSLLFSFFNISIIVRYLLLIIISSFLLKEIRTKMFSRLIREE